MAPRVKHSDYLPNSTSYFVYVYDRLNKTMPHLLNNLAMDLLHNDTLLHRTSYKTVPSPHGLPPGVFLQLSISLYK
jgi:hypothetical protein